MSYEISCWICEERVFNYNAHQINTWWQQLFIMMTEVYNGRKKNNRVKADYERMRENGKSLDFCKSHIWDFCHTFMRIVGIRKADDTLNLTENRVLTAMNLLNSIDKSQRLRPPFFIYNARQFLNNYFEVLEPRPLPPDPPSEAEEAKQPAPPPNGPLTIQNGNVYWPRRLTLLPGYFRVPTPPPDEFEYEEEEDPVVQRVPVERYRVQPIKPAEIQEEPRVKTIRFANDVDYHTPVVKTRNIKDCDLCKQLLPTSEVVRDHNQLLGLFCAIKDQLLTYREAQGLLEHTRLFICCSCLNQAAHTLARILEVKEPKQMENAKEAVVEKFMQETRKFAPRIDLGPDCLNKCKKYSSRYWDVTEPRKHSRRRSYHGQKTTPPPAIAPSRSFHSNSATQASRSTRALSVLIPGFENPHSPRKCLTKAEREQKRTREGSVGSQEEEVKKPRMVAAPGSGLLSKIIAQPHPLFGPSRNSMEPCSSGSSAAVPVLSSDFHQGPEEKWRVPSRRTTIGAPGSSGSSGSSRPLTNGFSSTATHTRMIPKPPILQHTSSSASSASTSSTESRVGQILKTFTAAKPIKSYLTAGSSGSGSVPRPDPLRGKSVRPELQNLQRRTPMPNPPSSSSQPIRPLRSSTSRPASQIQVHQVSSSTSSRPQFQSPPNVSSSPDSQAFYTPPESIAQRVIPTRSSASGSSGSSNGSTPVTRAQKRPQSRAARTDPPKQTRARSMGRPQTSQAVRRPPPSPSPSPPPRPRVSRSRPPSRAATSLGQHSDGRKNNRTRFCAFCWEKKPEPETRSMQIDGERRAMFTWAAHAKEMPVDRAKHCYATNPRTFLCPHHRVEFANAMLAYFKATSPDRILSAPRDLLMRLVGDAKKVLPPESVKPDEFLHSCHQFVKSYWQS